MTVCFTDEGNASGKRPVSERNLIGRPGENIRPQNVVARGGTYDNDNNLGYVYESSGSDFSETYDPTDYADGNGDSFDTGDVRGLNCSGNYNEEIKAADIIE